VKQHQPRSDSPRAQARSAAIAFRQRARLQAYFICCTFCTIRYHLNILARLRGGRGPCWFWLGDAARRTREIRSLTVTPLTGLVYKADTHSFDPHYLLKMPIATYIVDVHTQTPLGASSGDVDNGVPAAIISGLSKPAHQRTLPTLLLYTETGLRIYDELTTKATEYYLFGAEEDILKNHGDEIIQAMHSRGCVEGESVVELGAGQVHLPPLPHFHFHTLRRILVDCAHWHFRMGMRYRTNRYLLDSMRAP